MAVRRFNHTNLASGVLAGPESRETSARHTIGTVNYPGAAGSAVWRNECELHSAARVPRYGVAIISTDGSQSNEQSVRTFSRLDFLRLGRIQAEDDEPVLTAARHETAIVTRRCIAEIVAVARLHACHGGGLR